MSNISDPGWQTVYSTNDEVEANLKQGILEYSGITCVIEASVYRPRAVVPLYNVYNLNVPAAQKQKAEQIIDRVNQQKDE